MRRRRRYHSGDYRTALASTHWRRLKADVYRYRAHGHCEAFLCRVRRRLELHHLHYDTLRFERPCDVRLLCPRHHAKADRRRRALRR